MRNPTTPNRRRRLRRNRDDRGAALVEFALVSLPLFTILFGTIEFGWAFYQLNDVRHGAREGIRLVVVDATVSPSYTDGTMTDGDLLAQATCDRMDESDNVTIAISVVDLDGSGTDYDVGDDVTLTATKPLAQMTKMFDAVLGSVVLDETITSRLEQDPADDLDGTNWACK